MLKSSKSKGVSTWSPASVASLTPAALSAGAVVYEALRKETQEAKSLCGDQAKTGKLAKELGAAIVFLLKFRIADRF